MGVDGTPNLCLRGAFMRIGLITVGMQCSMSILKSYGIETAAGCVKDYRI